MMMCSNTVWEMKNNEKAAKQLYARMLFWLSTNCQGFERGGIIDIIWCMGRLSTTTRRLD